MLYHTYCLSQFFNLYCISIMQSANTDYLYMLSVTGKMGTVFGRQFSMLFCGVRRAIFVSEVVLKYLFKDF